MIIQATRFPIVDFLRAWAIVLMFIFHLCYDLTLFHWLSIDFEKHNFWFYLPRFIVTLFLFCMGCGLVISNPGHIRWKKFWRRFAKIAVAAILVSVATFITFRARWIYFGTLHCIALTSLLALPFIKVPRISLFTGIFIIISQWIFGISVKTISGLIEHKSMDFIPPYPWLGVVLLGIWAAHTRFLSVPLKNAKINQFCGFLSKHSLLIYLGHQPLLFGFVWFISWIRDRHL